MAIMKKSVLYKCKKGKLKELHTQLNIMAGKTGIAEEYFVKRYSKRISSIARVNKAKSITRNVDHYIAFCKKTIDIYDKIVENKIFHPDKLKGKIIPQHFLFIIAEEISRYPRFKAIDKLKTDRERYIEYLDNLKRMKKLFRHGMGDDVKILINKKIDNFESRVARINKYFESLVFAPTINTMLKINLRPSTTKDKDISLTYLLSCIYVMIKVKTNLSNSAIYARIADLFIYLEELPKVSHDEKFSVRAIAGRFKKARNYGIAESYLFALTSRRDNPFRKSAFPKLDSIFDVKYDHVKTKKIYKRLSKRLKSFAEN
jgi:hypothetical protein